MKNYQEKKRIRQQKIFSTGLYILNSLWFFLPWISLGEKHCGVPQIAFLLHRDGIEKIAAQIEGVSEDLHALNAGVHISLAIYFALFFVGIAYVVTVLAEKNWKLNVVTIFLAVAACYLGIDSHMIGGLAPGSMAAYYYPFVFLIICTVEFFGRKFIELWDDTKEKIAVDQKLDQQFKEEKKRRLSYPGKYSGLFFKVIWKNFRKNLKDYLVLLICNGITFFCVLGGLLLHQSLQNGDSSADAGYLVGSGKVLFQSVVELMIVGVFMLVLLLLYYFRRRLPEYGVFQTLGIRRKTLYLCIGTELGVGAVISLAVGAVLAGVWFGVNLPAFLFTLLKAVGVMLMLYLITFFVTHDLFVGMQMGNQTDLTMMKERMPKRYHAVFFLIGCGVCVWVMLRYAEIVNFEGIWNLVFCSVGIYLILRFGEAWYFVRWEKGREHLKSLLPYHPFFHRSRTTVWYLFGLCVMQICILSVFAVQMFSPRLVTDVDALFPYDLVCLMNQEDTQDIAFAESLSGMEGVETTVYPMFRVSGTDATEQAEGGGQEPIAGQQIGISESTYHALKRALDPDYKERELGLDADGKKIYIVHQQDKSTKGQPIDFKTNRKTPLLYTGPVCEYVDSNAHNTEYFRREIVGEEISSLIGVFCQGERENLVVFSDAYFEEAKELWKKTNRFTGTPLTQEELPLREELTMQGPSGLLLVQADESILQKLQPELDAFQERHAEDEKYDGRVKSYYRKEKGMHTVYAELSIKEKMGRMVTMTFFAACILLILVKMLTEQRSVAKKLEFLTCMGMRKKEKRKLVRFEMRVYYVVTMVLSFVVSLGLIWAVFQARMYTKTDIGRMAGWMLPFAVVDLLLFGAVLTAMTEVYIRRVESA